MLCQDIKIFLYESFIFFLVVLIVMLFLESAHVVRLTCHISSLAYHMNGWWATTATTSIFLAAAFTDWLDGYIARKVCGF